MYLGVNNMYRMCQFSPQPQLQRKQKGIIITWNINFYKVPKIHERFIT